MQAREAAQRMYQDEHIEVRASPIEGMGVFARRAFAKGETIVAWNPKRLTPEEHEQLPDDQHRYVNVLKDGTVLYMQPPERYVNSSEEPNTEVQGWSDVAIRDISPGEEITSNYPIG